MAKTINTRICNKHDKESNWNIAAENSNFTPKAGEIIIYDVDETHSEPRIKIGDGVTRVDFLPYATAEAAASIDTNTTYDLSASGSSNGTVNINLTAGGSGSGTDSIALKGTGNTTVTASGNTITINSTGGGTSGPSLSNSTPKSAGTGFAGTSSEASRADHIHPKELTATGVGAGSYGPSSSATLSDGSSFSVPYITVDANGRVTKAATKTFTLSTGGGSTPEEPEPEPDEAVGAPSLSITTDGILTINEGTGPSPSYYVISVGDETISVNRTGLTQTVDMWPYAGPQGPGNCIIRAYAQAASGSSNWSSFVSYNIPEYECDYWCKEKAEDFYDFREDVSFPTYIGPDYGNYWLIKDYIGMPDDFNWSFDVTYDPDDVVSSLGWHTNDGVVTIVALSNRYGTFDFDARYTANYNGRRCWIVQHTEIEFDWCLLEGTQILMADGTTKAIEDVKSGDVLRSWDVENNEYVDVKCLSAYYTGKDSEWKEYTFDDGNTLRIAKSHAIYSASEGYAVSSTGWKVDDAGVNANGEQPHLKTITPKTSDVSKRHYSLVTENNLYFADGILCGHNPGKKYTMYKGNTMSTDIPEEQVALFKEEWTGAHLATDWKEDPKFKERAREFGRYNDFKAEQETVKGKLSARDYKTVKRMQGVLSDEEWDENLKICAELRDQVNALEEKKLKVLRHHRKVREELGYPRNPRNRKKLFQDYYKADMEYIRSRNAKLKEVTEE